MMSQLEKKTYEAPTLTVVTIKAERGYAISSATLDADLHLFEWSTSDPYVTQYDDDASWADYSWN